MKRVARAFLKTPFTNALAEIDRVRTFKELKTIFQKIDVPSEFVEQLRSRGVKLRSIIAALHALATATPQITSYDEILSTLETANIEGLRGPMKECPLV